MKNSFNIAFVIVASVLMVSCFNSSRPNYQYMPNMYVPVGYETYGEYEIFPGGQEAMLPAEGTIPRGWQPYDYPNTTEGLNLAKAELKSPIPVTEESLANGEKLYTIYCAICHGGTGDGKGPLVQNEKILGVPSYADPGRTITEGGIYHVQMFGLNAMGSYASQVSEVERWQIAQHVLNLKATLEGTPLLTPESSSMEAASNENTETEAVTTSEEQH